MQSLKAKRAFPDSISAPTLEVVDSNDLDRVKAAEKNEERFERILREYGQALGRLSFGYERVASARDELMQEIALAIWQALPQFRESARSVHSFIALRTIAASRMYAGGGRSMPRSMNCRARISRSIQSHIPKKSWPERISGIDCARLCSGCRWSIGRL